MDRQDSLLALGRVSHVSRCGNSTGHLICRWSPIIIPRLLQTGTLGSSHPRLTIPGSKILELMLLLWEVETTLPSLDTLTQTTPIASIQVGRLADIVSRSDQV